jgi:hypothetical protein
VTNNHFGCDNMEKKKEVIMLFQCVDCKAYPKWEWIEGAAGDPKEDEGPNVYKTECFNENQKAFNLQYKEILSAKLNHDSDPKWIVSLFEFEDEGALNQRLKDHKCESIGSLFSTTNADDENEYDNWNILIEEEFDGEDICLLTSPQKTSG